EKKISKFIGKGIYRFKMIKPDDKILVAVSGGKDSLTLLHDLVNRQSSFPIKYQLAAAYIHSEFSQSSTLDKLETIFQNLNIEYHILNIPIIERLKEGRKMNCFWCSTQRRTELIRLSDKIGFNKIALGHHLDDIIETYLMNIFFKAEVSTMLPALSYDKFKQTIIRPLALVPEKWIVKYAKEKQFDKVSCECGYDHKSKRLAIRQMLRNLEKIDKGIKLNIFKSMSNVNLDYLFKD
ncbi:MAG: tRNA 2-thiocytidine biosynthesis protein TtcA, partial [Spirochaetes bacterium]|nr:tRNA 2-thiocytidine biosynthesis protein TtcA [Spirochaetota bacterium]